MLLLFIIRIDTRKPESGIVLTLCTYQCQAGARGIGRDFDRSLWPGGRAFEFSCCPGGRDI